jgi:hypothetical protein
VNNRDFKIKASVLRAFNRIASTDATRLVINGVHVELDSTGYTLVATDGRRLLSMRGDDQIFAESCQFIIPRPLIESMPPLFGRLPVRVFFDERVVIITDDALVLEYPKIEGNYPKWRDVVPKDWPGQFNGAALTADFDYFADILISIKEITDSSHCSVAQEGEDDPICFRPKRQDYDLFALQMPITGQFALNIPFWARNEN